MSLSFISKLLLCISFGSVVIFASPLAMYTFTGIQQPYNPANGHSNQGPSDFLGIDCISGTIGPNGGGCVLGAPVFDIASASLVQNTATNWTLTIVTNGPQAGSGSLEGFNQLAFGDVLIQYGVDATTPTPNPVDYGIAIGSPTAAGSTETLGGLYKQNQTGLGKNTADYPATYLTALQAGYTSGGREQEPVWINPANMNNLIGSPVTNGFSVTCLDSKGNTETVTDTVGSGGIPGTLCNNLPSGYNLYTITDTFNAPTGFLDPANGPFSFEVASFVCANGLIIATTPEPRALFLIVIPVMFLLGRRLSRSRGVQVS